MADGERNHAVESGNISKMGRVDGFNFVSFENGEEVDYFVEYPRKRTTKRPLAALALPLANDTETRLKKRNRKGDKRFIEDKLDGFTFVSAFSLNDFDEYDKAKPRCAPPAPNKRKSTTKIESATSKKKPRKPVNTSETLVTCADAVEEASSNLISDEHRISDEHQKETVSNVKKKSLSPLTKSALVRLKRINVSSLKQNVAKNKQVEDIQDCRNKPPKINQKHTSRSRRKQSFNLKIPHMQINKFNEAVSNQPDMITVSDSDDMKELDVCGIDESASSSQFIMNNMKTSNKKNLNPVIDVESEKQKEKLKPKRKPCMTCCAHPCRIVGAKKVESSGFPTFDVSYTTKCKSHPAGEIIVHDASAEKVDVCIQATSSDIKMHLDFAKRFPYNAISVVSCQPSLDDEDFNLSVIPEAGATVSVSEVHRVTELKRREEQHGLYCKLAETLDISKQRASKQWILQTALKEIKNLEAESTILTATTNLEKQKNEKLRKRWKELSGKHYVAPNEENAAKMVGKSKLLELYMKYRQDMKEESQKTLTEKEKQEMKECKLDVACNISEKHIGNVLVHTSSNNTPAGGKSNNSNVKMSQAVSNMKEPIKSMSVKPRQVGSHNKVMQTNTNQLVTTAKHTSVGPRLAVRPFHHKPNILRRTPVIPRIDLTNQSETPSSSHLLERNSNPIRTSCNPRTQVSSSLPFKRPPPTQSSTHQSTTQLPPPTQTNTHLSTTNLPPPIQSNDHLGCTNVPPTTQSATHLVPPTQTHLNTTPLPPTSTTHLSTTCTPPPDQSSVHLYSKPLVPPTQSSTNLRTTPVASISVSGATNKNAALPSKPLAHNESVVVTVVVRGKTMAFRVPKTAEGLGMLSRLSLMKQMSANNIAKIAKHFSPSNQLGHLTMTTPVDTNLVWTTPTQWSAVAIAQNPTATPTSSATPTPTSATSKSHAVGQPSDATKQQNNVVFLDLTSMDKSKAEAFSVIPHSSSINLTLNKVGSITANKVFNLRPPRSRPQTILPKPRNGQTLHRPVLPTIPRPSTNVPATIPSTTSAPTRVPSTSVPTTCPPSTGVHIYPLPPQIPLNTSVSQLQTIVPHISDSLLETSCGSDQDSMNDPGMCVISNVFSLTDTVLGATPSVIGTPNGLQTTRDDATVEASKADTSDIQSPNVVECNSISGDDGKSISDSRNKWQVEVMDSSTKHS